MKASSTSKALIAICIVAMSSCGKDTGHNGNTITEDRIAFAKRIGTDYLALVPPLETGELHVKEVFIVQSIPEAVSMELPSVFSYPHFQVEGREERGELGSRMTIALANEKHCWVLGVVDDAIQARIDAMKRSPFWSSHSFVEVGVVGIAIHGGQWDAEELREKQAPQSVKDWLGFEKQGPGGGGTGCVAGGPGSISCSCCGCTVHCRETHYACCGSEGCFCVAN